MAIIKGTTLADVLTSEAGLDTITGLGGNDVVVVAAAADHPVGEGIDGGTGFDRLWFASSTGGETLVLDAAVRGIEQVELVNAVGVAGNAALNVNASALAAVTTGFTLIGNAGANILTGTKGNDLIIGGAGADTIVGGLGNDRIVMSVASIDQIDAGDLPTEFNTLVLIGAPAAIAMINLSVAAGADQLTAFGAAPEALVQSDFRNVDASGMINFGVNITASQASNVLTGTAVADAFVYLAPMHITGDKVNGGAGSDSLYFASTTAKETLIIGAAVNVERALVADAAGLTTGTTELNLSAAAVLQKIELIGNDGINRLTGSAFADTLNGNAGADLLSGGSGNDVYVADAAADWVALDKISDSGGTDDRIAFADTQAGATLTLGTGIAGIESVWTTSTGFNIAETNNIHADGSALKVAMSFVGNAGANSLAGGTGNDTFNGNAGTDSIAGGAGADVVFLDVATPDQADGGLLAEGNTLMLDGNAVAAIDFDLTVAADADQSLALAQTQADFLHIDASEMGAMGVIVTPGTQVNLLKGSEQDDVFVILSQAHLGMDKIEGLGQGTDGDKLRFATIAATAQTLMLTASVLGVETVEISDAAGDNSGTVGHSVNAAALTTAVKLLGNFGGNTLTGTKFGDTLQGAEGADVLVGGLGDDVYLYTASGEFAVGEKITDSGGGDTILFESTAAGDVLAVSGVAGIESYRLDEDGTASIGFDLSALAAAAAANVTGNDAGNLLRGTKGADTIYGGLGDDTIEGGDGADSIEGAEGADSILAGAGADIVVMSLAEMDALNLGAVTEKNKLILSGLGSDTIDLSSTVDQILSDLAVQVGITYLDASRMEVGPDPDPNVFGIRVIGRDTQPGGGDIIIGSPRADEFFPGRGADTIEGGGGHDTWIVSSIAEFTGDVYTDSGGTRGDYLYFNLPAGSTIKVDAAQIVGIDVVACFEGGAPVNMNIDLSAVNQSVSMAGNSQKNVLTGLMMVLERDAIKGVERFIVSGSDLPFLPQPGNYTRDITVTAPGGFDASDFTTAIHLAGNFGNNVLIGSEATTAGDTIMGWAGHDVVVGGKGNDDIFMDVGDRVSEAASMPGANGADSDDIDAGLGADRLFLQGKPAGIVVVDLLAADQVVSIDNVADAPLQQGFDNYVDASQMQRPTGDTIPPTANFGVHLMGRDTGKDTLIGTNDDDLFIGRGGADSMVGLSGDDVFVVLALADIGAGEVMDGGDGEDTLRFASTIAGQTLTINLGVMQELEAVVISDATGDTSGTTALNVNASAVQYGMQLVGNDGNNSLVGTAFNDTISGNDGLDTLQGGAGDDLYLFDDPNDAEAGDRIIDSGGLDTVRFVSGNDGDSIVLTALTGLLAQIERVEIWDGADTLVGSLALGVDAGGFANPLTLMGSKFNNTLAGGAGADTIDGGDGNDSIVGNGGADRILSDLTDTTADDIDAGATSEGNTLVLTGELDVSMEWDLTSGTDQLVSVHTTDHVVLGVTHLDLGALTGDFGITITGTADANTLITGEFDDVFITATPFVAGERITARGGTDELRFTSLTAGQTLLLSNLITGLERVLLSDATGLDLTGTTALNVNAAAIVDALEIYGNAGNNTLIGTGKADTIIGGGGTDSIVGGLGADEIKITADTALSAATGGALAEGNSLAIDGTLATALTVNLKAATGDQITGAGDSATQSGFAHLDASGMTAASVIVTGSDAANRIYGTAGADSINGGKGADSIGVHVDGGADTVMGGDNTVPGAVIAEGNELVLLGAGAPTVDLSVLAGDQLTSLLGVQGGFSHVDASKLTGGGATITGSAAANRITGSAQADTAVLGAGADVFVWDVATPGDTVDAGNPGEGDTLVIIGVRTGGALAIDLSVAPNADQIASIAGVQSDFQHVNAGKMEDFGVNITGNGFNNNLTGTVKADTLTGGAGADVLILGGGPTGDDQSDQVNYLARGDGASSVAVPGGFDRIKEFDAGTDRIRIAGELNLSGGLENLDDISDNNVFTFSSDAKANFGATHEALFISFSKSKLVGETSLVALASAAGAINAVGVIAATGEDGLIVLQSSTSAAFYYYLESDATANSVSAGELTLLGLIEAQATPNDFMFG